MAARTATNHHIFQNNRALLFYLQQRSECLLCRRADLIKSTCLCSAIKTYLCRFNRN
jgi:hypothetical protein